MKLTWQVLSQTGKTVWSLTKNHAVGTWWPQLTPDFCQLVAGAYNWDIVTQEANTLQKEMPTVYGVSAVPWTPIPIGCATVKKRCELASTDFYVCPKDRRNSSTAYHGGGYDYYFCAAWVCETTGDAYWRPSSSWDKIIVHRGWNRPPNLVVTVKITLATGIVPPDTVCPSISPSFTPEGKKATDWAWGSTWGLCWYMTGEDRGINFKIQLKTEQVSYSIGPNQVLPDQKAPSPQHTEQSKKPTLDMTTPSPSSNRTNTPGPIGSTLLVNPSPSTGYRMMDLIRGAYIALNTTQPNRTKDCWLCLVATPPYYEGVAIVGNYSNHTNLPPACSILIIHKLTLPQVTGQGTCIGKVPPSHWGLYNLTDQAIPGSYYLQAPNGTYWACNTGLTPCISAVVLNQTSDDYVLVQVLPHISYHHSEDFLPSLDDNSRHK